MINVLPIVGYLRGLAVVIVLGMVVGVIAVRLVNRKLDRLKLNHKQKKAVAQGVFTLCTFVPAATYWLIVRP